MVDSAAGLLRGLGALVAAGGISDRAIFPAGVFRAARTIRQDCRKDTSTEEQDGANHGQGVLRTCIGTTGAWSQPACSLGGLQRLPSAMEDPNCEEEDDSKGKGRTFVSAGCRDDDGRCMQPAWFSSELRWPRKKQS